MLRLSKQFALICKLQHFIYVVQWNDKLAALYRYQFFSSIFVNGSKQSLISIHYNRRINKHLYQFERIDFCDHYCDLINSRGKMNAAR